MILRLCDLDKLIIVKEIKNISSALIYDMLLKQITLLKWKINITWDNNVFICPENYLFLSFCFKDVWQIKYDHVGL